MAIILNSGQNGCNTNPCANDYAGVSPESELEIIAILDELDNTETYKNIRSWITVNQKDSEESGNVQFSSLLDIARQSNDRHEIFLTEKVANAMTRFSIDEFLYKSAAHTDDTGSMEWARHQGHHSLVQTGFSPNMSSQAPPNGPRELTQIDTDIFFKIPDYSL